MRKSGDFQLLKFCLLYSELESEEIAPACFLSGAPSWPDTMLSETWNRTHGMPCTAITSQAAP